MQEPQAHAIADQIYLAHTQGDVALANAYWMGTPDYLRSVVQKHLDERIVKFDNPQVFEQCVGWGAMAQWLRDYQPHMPMDAVAQCPRILTAWWKKEGRAVWPTWAHQSLGSLLWMDACTFLAGGHWHLWGSSEDHIVAHLSHYYASRPNALSPKQQEVLKTHVDAFALTNERFMTWLNKQSFYNQNWDDALFMQTHNHHRHACQFDARLLNPHSRGVAYYIAQVRVQEQAPFSDGYWFFPDKLDADSIFARVLIAACPDITFHCNTLVDAHGAKHAHLLQSLVLHQTIDPDLSMLVQWLRNNSVAVWGVVQESTVGPW